MIANYLIYFNSLQKEQQLKQFLIILLSFLILFAIGMFLESLKSNHLNDTKDSLFQRFLKKL